MVWRLNQYNLPGSGFDLRLDLKDTEAGELFIIWMVSRSASASKSASEAEVGAGAESDAGTVTGTGVEVNTRRGVDDE